jgi:hypothetical protein
MSFSSKEILCPTALPSTGITLFLRYYDRLRLLATLPLSCDSSRLRVPFPRRLRDLPCCVAVRFDDMPSARTPAALSVYSRYRIRQLVPSQQGNWSATACILEALSVHFRYGLSSPVIRLTRCVTTQGPMTRSRIAPVQCLPYWIFTNLNNAPYHGAPLATPALCLRRRQRLTRESFLAFLRNDSGSTRLYGIRLWRMVLLTFCDKTAGRRSFLVA